MFFQYKKVVIICSFVLWSVILFVFGMSFREIPSGSEQSPIQPPDLSTVHKVNEEVGVTSHTEGNLTYRISEVSYTKSKHIIFHLNITEMSSFHYLVFVRDAQNQDIKVEELHLDKAANDVIFQFQVPETELNSELFIFVYPVSEDTLTNKKVSDKAFGKTMINVQKVREETIEQLKG